MNDILCDRKKCKAHRVYIGGIMDGEVVHLLSSKEDHPKVFGTLLRDGQRSWYKLNRKQSTLTKVVYDCVYIGRIFIDVNYEEVKEDDQPE